MLNQPFSWLIRKGKWAHRREYEVRRENQYDQALAFADTLTQIIGNLFGETNHESLLLKPYDEEQKRSKAEQSSNEGIVTKLWWKPKQNT